MSLGPNDLAERVFDRPQVQRAGKHRRLGCLTCTGSDDERPLDPGSSGRSIMRERHTRGGGAGGSFCLARLVAITMPIPSSTMTPTAIYIVGTFSR